MAGTATYGLKPVVLGSLTILFGTILLKRLRLLSWGVGRALGGHGMHNGCDFWN